jgi:beta-glucosidase
MACALLDGSRVERHREEARTMIDTHENRPATSRADTGTFRFPPRFMFGAATSAHQVEGHCTNNDWWAWEQGGCVREPSGAACEHFERFREDFELAHELGHNTHRFSLEWSRIEPSPGRFSSNAIAHYGEVLTTLRGLGIEPVVTLHHFTLPLWMVELGGWESDEMVARFERYVGVVVDALGGLARWWITLNEPMPHVWKSYVAGEWPPGKRDYGAAARALRNMLHAHVAAYRAIHARRPDAKVSIAHHALALSADDPHRWRDRLSVALRGYLVNHLFVDALHRGAVRVPGVLWERLEAARTLDFIGVNYYTRDYVRNTGFDLPGLLGDFAHRDHRQSVRMRNALGWEVYPDGLGRVLRELSRYQLPILISENGTSSRSDGDRWSFISMHLWQVARAIREGVPVIGYLYWSLLDNFEWAEGYGPRFGLIEVDFATQVRRVRPCAWYLRDVIRRNAL